MNCYLKCAVLGFALLLLFAPLQAQDSDFEVAPIKFDATTWGANTAHLNITYKGYEYKFIVAAAVVEFTEGPLLPRREYRSNFMMEPESTSEIELPILIPASYGKGTIKIELYDVVDTLDQLLESQSFFSKSFPIEFGAPPRLTDELNLDIALPVLMEQNELFDNAISRLVPVFLSRGKSVEEIAKLCNSTPDVIQAEINLLGSEKFLIKAGQKIRPAFMVIEKDDIDALMPALDSTVETLYKTIKANYVNFEEMIETMTEAGELSADKNDVLDPLTILNHRYPLTLTFVLWNLLGRNVITGGMPFDIFSGSDPCNGKMGNFFYMVPAGDDYVGKTFYYQSKVAGVESIYCGYGEFDIVCEANYKEKEKNNIPARWFFARDSNEMAYIFNSRGLMKPVTELIRNCDVPVDKLKSRIEEHFKGYLYDMHGEGVRYWAWNMVVTKLMDKFEANGDMDKEGSGLYTFQQVEY